jgi:hypothetical protein
MAYTPSVLAWNGPVTKSPTLSGTGAQSDNLFTVTGACECIVRGRVTTASTNMTVLQLEEYDGTAAVDITASGVTLSALAAGTAVFRNGLAASTLALSDNAAGDVIEGGDAGQNGVETSFIVNAKTAVTTYIRATYSSTENPDSGVIEWTCYWRPLFSGSGVVAA